MLAMMALGVPMYVCATASIPVAAAMVAKGVSPGAALVFLMTGPATNAATVGVLWRTMGRRAAALYVAVVAVSALASGMLLNALFAGGGLSGEHIHNMQMLPTWLKTVAAIVLLALIVLPRFLTKHASHDSCELGDDERGLDLEVSGMTCQHCAESARKAGMACSGVRDVQVDLKGGKVHVAGTAPDIDELQKALAGVGFQAKLAKSR
jgi:copper chaperone CopZ